MTMPQSKGKWITGPHSIFFWTGIFLTLSCVALVLLQDTAMIHPVEHSGLPLSCVLGVAAILQFVAAEICHHASPNTSRPEPGYY